MSHDLPLSDAERFPAVGPSERVRLQELREHPHAPRFNLECGDRLTAEGQQRVGRFERQLFAGNAGWRIGEPPAWVIEYARSCLLTVPFYRRRGGSAASFASIPPFTRGELQNEPWSFVPDPQPLDGLINYWTSGASGHSMNVLSHPEVASMRLPVFRRAMARYGLTLDGGSGRTAILFVCSQSTTFTYVSLSSYLGGAAHVKINLHPGDWRDPDDRVRFIDALDPEVLSGDPLSFLDLARLPVTIRPKALISSAMLLMPAIRQELEARFGCPVVDIYSTCETGPIAMALDDWHELFLHDVYLEILRPDGSVAAPGERGEIAFTGGRNPFLPMLRYRTGDWGALEVRNDVPVLIGLEGRAPVKFLTAGGQRINNLDITIALRPFALPQFTVHQNSDGSLKVGVAGALKMCEQLEPAFLSLFGAGQRIAFHELPEDGVKRVPYSSDLPDS